MSAQNPQEVSPMLRMRYVSPNYNTTNQQGEMGAFMNSWVWRGPYNIFGESAANLILDSLICAGSMNRRMGCELVHRKTYWGQDTPSFVFPRKHVQCSNTGLTKISCDKGRLRSARDDRRRVKDSNTYVNIWTHLKVKVQIQNIEGGT